MELGLSRNSHHKHMLTGCYDTAVITIATKIGINHNDFTASLFAPHTRSKPPQLTTNTFFFPKLPIVWCCLPATCSGECATSLVESHAHACVLQRTHALLAQYTPLPITWEQLWQHANTQQQGDQAEGGAGDSRTAAATIAGLLRLLDTAVYDAEAQVLLPVAEGAAAGVGDAVPGVVGVLAELEAALLPLKAFFGRQHLAALHAFLGPSGVQQLISAVLQKLDTEQVGRSLQGSGCECVTASACSTNCRCFYGLDFSRVVGILSSTWSCMWTMQCSFTMKHKSVNNSMVLVLLPLQKLLMEQLLSLQRQLPNALLRLPAAEQYHSAGAVLQFYQQQLSSALEDHRACAAALSTLQRIGNGLALLHLLSIQQAVHATPTFMQVILHVILPNSNAVL